MAKEPLSARKAGVGVALASALAALPALHRPPMAFAPAGALALLALKLLTSTGGIVTRDPAVTPYANAGYGG